MSKRTIRYYSVRRNGRGFWEPTKAMRKHGFANVPCGPDGPGAWAVAEQWNLRWDAARTGAAPTPAMASAENLTFENSEELTIYAPGSLGAAFRAYRASAEWDRKAPRTREDWWRGWKRIKPIFGDTAPKTVKLNDISAWRLMVETTVSLREAHRALKIWRALWKVAAALHYCVRDDDPSLAVRNTAAKGRSQTWTEGEAARLAKRAWRMGYFGLAAVIGVAWDSQMSPGDVRSLRASQMARIGQGQLCFTERGKTGTPVGGVLSPRSMRLLAGYLQALGTELTRDAYIFRNRSGQPYSKDTLGDDFRAVRAAEFGPLERRMLGHDFRRSGAVEAITGDATPSAVAHAMGNTLSASNVLFETYVPVNVGTIQAVFEARKKGRRALRS